MHDGILFASLVVLILYVFRVFQFLFGSDTFTKKAECLIRFLSVFVLVMAGSNGTLDILIVCPC
jgi:uncharacterized membrane protein